MENRGSKPLEREIGDLRKRSKPSKATGEFENKEQNARKGLGNLEKREQSAFQRLENLSNRSKPLKQY